MYVSTQPRNTCQRQQRTLALSRTEQEL